jgi:uncharacterized protein YehS (DUF1456 family)
MSTVKDIEAAISSLSPHDFSELREWFTKFEEAAWDRQIEEDARSGRLDGLYQKLQAENDGHPRIPLDEVINHQALLRELKATLEDLDDRRELAVAKKKNAGKPGTSLRDAAKELGI